MDVIYVYAGAQRPIGLKLVFYGERNSPGTLRSDTYIMRLQAENLAEGSPCCPI